MIKKLIKVRSYNRHIYSLYVNYCEKYSQSKDILL
jgi:hypothetical protein